MAFMLWNVRGANARIPEIRDILKEKNIDLFSLLETKIRQPTHEAFAKNFEDGWILFQTEMTIFQMLQGADTIWVIWKKGI